MHRILVPAGVRVGDRIPIPPDEAHHLGVRRARAGDPVTVLDGRGTVATGHLDGDGRAWLAAIDASTVEGPPPVTRLLVAAGDRDRFGWLVEKGVETGVTDIVPVETERTRDVASRLRDGALDKLGRRAAEALKQAGGAWLPALHPLVPLGHAAAAVRAGHRWLADAAGAVPPAVAPTDEVTVAIGPEGGFTEGERAGLIAAGFVPVRLAERTLRFETAAIAALVVVGIRRKDADE